MVSRYLGRAASAAALCAAFASVPAFAQVRVEVLSSRPELVTGGDALVKVTGASAAPTVTVAGRDVSAAFKSDSKGGYVGLVDGLKDGDNALVAKAGGAEATLTLTNHPINGTLIAGPQQTPFLCENEEHKLAPAKDATCAAPPIVNYYYRNTNKEWKPFDPKGQRPTDIGMTKTTEGKDAPLIVMQEKGVINRSAYNISILHDPAAGPLPSPTAASAGSAWNGKIAYVFGGGVQPNYHMGRGFGMTGTDGKFFLEDLGAAMQDNFITGGYAILQGSLNVMGTNNDDVKSAETMMKIKEYFIERFGPATYTIGHGASGGSMQQHLIANAYPGLFDGIMPARSYPDVVTFLQPLYDCEMIRNVVDKSSNNWTYEQKGAVAGKYWGYCVSNGTRYPNARLDWCDAAVKDMVANDPALKAKGIRCTFQDNLVNIFGKDPNTGFARNPYDNVGVQYGLNALNEGKISFAQFIELNGKIGGFDLNGKIVEKRQVGDAVALKRAYETGRVNLGTGGLKTIPIYDIRSYVDGDPVKVGDDAVDVHDGYHSKVMRARLLKYNGTAANQVMETVASLGRVQFDTRTEGSPLRRVAQQGLATMDKWIMAIKADASNKTQAEKVVANKPAGFVDACYPVKTGSLVKLAEDVNKMSDAQKADAIKGGVGDVEKVTDMAKCDQTFPFAGDARLAAGAPATDDVFKCQLKPVDAKDYKAALTAEQLAQIKQVFPEGVCDFSKPGVEQVALGGTWAVFTAPGEYKFLSRN